MNLVFKEKSECDEIFMIRCEKRGPPAPAAAAFVGTSSFVINKRLERVNGVQREAFRANEPWGFGA